ncbi:MAG TPA: hypothetical protein VMS73_06110 [Anaerolineaceae bacterium]|nr:hypothetical protein [Anaerolineaceae bacterium]
MEKTGPQLRQRTTGSDAAVSGLFGGLLGGLAMALVIALFSLLNGHGLGYLGYFSTATAVSPLQGLLMHLAVSCIYGMLFSLILYWTRLERLKVPGWLAGLVYAVLLWVLAVTVLLPAAHSLMLSIGWPAFFFGHLAYGLVLGWRRSL